MDIRDISNRILNGVYSIQRNDESFKSFEGALSPAKLIYREEADKFFIIENKKLYELSIYLDIISNDEDHLNKLLFSVL